MIPNPYTIIATAAVVIALSVGVYIEHLRLVACKAETVTATAARDTAIAANGDLTETMRKLEAANAELANGRAADKAASDKVIADLQTQRETLQQAVDAARRNRSIIYAQDPSAAVWARQRVPAAVADSLRAADHR